MRGHEYARTMVRTRLQSVLPVRLAAIRASLDVTTPINPPTAGYLLTDVLPSDPAAYPCVIVMSTSAPRIKRQSVAADGDTAGYICIYTVRVAVACRVDEVGGEEKASIDRDRLMLAVRESLMTRTSMPDDVDIITDDITEQVGAAAQDLRGRPLAAGEIQVQVACLETLAPIPAPDLIEDSEAAVSTTIVEV
jgi:hypothetical protein